MDKIVKKILSIFFRLIIILFGLSIVCSRVNYFEIYWYFIAIIPYVLIYFSTLFKDGLISKLRLLNDYLFIIFILYDKGVDYTTICYLLLPIVNSPNYTGRKKSIWLYVFFIISLYVLNKYQFNWSFVTVTLVFITINFIIDSKSRFFNNITKLNTEIESFLENQLELRKSYKVYTGILNVLNRIKFLMFYQPNFKNIVCFKIQENRLILENSSVFVWSYNIVSDEIIKLMNNPKLNNYDLSNIPFELNENDASKNIFIFNKTKTNNYVFIFIIANNSKSQSNNSFNLYYISLLQSITSRIARVLDLESSIKNENKKILKTFREKYFHMQNAEKAMHFIRNRFNTLDNFIEMSKDNIAGNMDSEDLKMYSTELQRLERNYDILMTRVGNILNKPDKPFSATQLEFKSPNYLFAAVRDIWYDYFNDFKFQLNWNIKTIDLFLIQINNDGLFILLTDWINNLKKYSIGNEIISFNETESCFNIIFSNKYNQSHKKDIIELKEDFNSKDRDRILKRTSHGIIIMKSILDEMSVKGEIINDSENLKLTLSFKKVKNENSNF
jgi:hypothetical protein